MSRLVDIAASGEEVVIARAGKPVARLTALPPKAPDRRPGLLKGRLVIADDFDAPLPREIMDAFYKDPIEPSRD